MTNPKPKTAVETIVSLYRFAVLDKVPEGDDVMLFALAVTELDERLRQLEPTHDHGTSSGVKIPAINWFVAEPPRSDLSEVITLMKGFLKEYEKPAWWRSDQQWHAMREAIAILERAREK